MVLLYILAPDWYNRLLITTRCNIYPKHGPHRMNS